MKTKLLSFLFLIITMHLSAQITHDLNWEIGIGTNIDLTIDIGDTVRWTWTDGAPHTVTSFPGSTETFNSGNLTGNGQTFSHTFTQEGSNPYRCVIHPATMAGTITVNPALGIEDISFNNFSISPNPAKNFIKIQLPGFISEAKIIFFDVLGKQIYGTNNVVNTPIDISSWSSGLYFVKVSSQNKIKTKRFIKQ